MQNLSISPPTPTSHSKFTLNVKSEVFCVAILHLCATEAAEVYNMHLLISAHCTGSAKASPLFFTALYAAPKVIKVILLSKA